MKKKINKTSVPDIQNKDTNGKKFKVIDKEPHELDYYGIHLRRIKKW